MLCDFCRKEFTKLIHHIAYCKDNPNRSTKVGKPKGIPPWNKGKTGFVTSVETRAKIGIKSRGRTHSVETKEKMSQQKKDLYASGWEPTCGRSKKYKYSSPIAGDISVDGTWELIVAKYLDFLRFTWQRNRKRFPYIHLNGKDSTYQPDFYIEEIDCYIEVKGYETDLDRCKWNQFPHKLKVWRRKEIQTMEDELARS